MLSAPVLDALFLFGECDQRRLSKPCYFGFHGLIGQKFMSSAGYLKRLLLPDFPKMFPYIDETSVHFFASWCRAIFIYHVFDQNQVCDMRDKPSASANKCCCQKKCCKNFLSSFPPAACGGSSYALSWPVSRSRGHSSV